MGTEAEVRVFETVKTREPKQVEQPAKVETFDSEPEGIDEEDDELGTAI